MDNKSYCNTCKVWYDKNTESYRNSDGHLKHKGMCMDDNNYLLTGMTVDMMELTEFKTQPYDKFIESVMEISDSLYNPLTMDYFNEVIEKEEEIVINIPTLDDIMIQPSFDKRCTNGELLYKFSQYLPDDCEDADELFGNHAYFEGFIKTNDGSYNINC